MKDEAGPRLSGYHEVEYEVVELEHE